MSKPYKMNRIIIEDELKGQETILFCNSCKMDTAHIILKEVQINYFETDLVDIHGKNEENTYGYYSNHKILECARCKSIVFRSEKYSDDDISHDDDDFGQYNEYIEIFPPRKELAVKEFDFSSISVATIYRETIECYNNNLNTMCGAAIRALVESICDNQGIVNGPTFHSDGKLNKRKSTTIEGKINGLFERGLLTKDRARKIHTFRHLGNESVHKMASSDRSELLLSIEIIEGLLNEIYNENNKWEQLHKNRTKKNKKILGNVGV